MIRPDTLEHLAIPGVVHGFFDRNGGVSLPPADSLNLAHGEGEEEGVAENRRRVLAFFGRDMDLVTLRQVHGDRVFIVGKRDGRRDGLADHQTPEGDALCSDIPGKLLMILTADCQPILFADPVKKVVAAAHAGWRGSVQNIAAATVKAMAGNYGCRPEDIRAGIGPSLGPCCAEFVNWKKELPPAFEPFRSNGNLFDFWAITEKQLTDAGLQPDHIASLNVCTRCNDGWFSYRREKNTGRLGAVIGLLP
ncbi:peptidoglycan editing factor PgeF [Desulfobotulus sp. H1]|uniref:Purine nucleoside phosphorylase n=1 Tax=Desulfobotulus pelophilus TaxID=2823377 RepID=A0ABT3N630_9BACT|nr:peptidoglycan editing factor PgeF [Desulfobotulus pelophilus]MCW7752921.1 peptidoglycan editing factor PgeF [Desulfobotulus pelophilus]